MIKPGYLNYIHTFRGLAIVGIVAIHCRIAFAWESVFQEKILELLFDNSTILFVFIAGFLFEHLKYKFQYIPYLKRKAKYVLLPYAIVSIPAIAEKIYLTNEWQGSDINGFIYYLFSGKQFGPFWFIPMIAIFYLITPLLLRLNTDFFYKLIFPLLFIAGLFFFRFGYYSTIGDSFLYFFPIYLLGMMASKYKDHIHQHNNRIGIAMLIAYLSLLILEATGILPAPRLRSFGQAQTDPWLLFNGAKLKMSILCFLMISFFYKLKSQRFKVVNLLGDYSFGVYFLHLYFIVLSQYIVNQYFEGFTFNLLSYTAYLITVLGLSLLSVYVVKLAFGRNSRLLVGS